MIGTSELGKKLTAIWNEPGCRQRFHLCRWVWSLPDPITNKIGLIAIPGKKIYVPERKNRWLNGKAKRSTTAKANAGKTRSRVRRVVVQGMGRPVATEGHTGSDRLRGGTVLRH